MSTWPTVSKWATALAGLLVLAACGTGHPAASAPQAATPGAASPDPPGSGTARPSPSASPALDGCFTAARGVIRAVPDAGGGTLTLATVGRGPRVVVLSNESDENLCSWLPLATRLATSGYRVVLWDYGGNLSSDELVGLVKRLRSAGAARVVLMGASERAKASLIAGAHISPKVRGVVSLSAESVLQPRIMVVNSVRRLHCPLLLVTATQDPYGSAPAAHEFLAAAPSQAKRLVTVPGTEHGPALLSGPSAARTLPAILAFLRHVMGGPPGGAAQSSQ
jgi:pimeloyl-ACP methyl ester carboxylesterase